MIFVPTATLTPLPSFPKGRSPVALALKGTVLDLTQIARHQDGKSPTDDLEKMILGEKVMDAVNGSSELPV